MKKILRFSVLILSVIMIVTAAAGCSLSGGSDEPAPDITVDQVIGSWEYQYGTSVESYIFNSNMTYSKSYLGATGENVYVRGTFEVSGNKLILTNDVKEKSEHEVRFPDEKTMKWGSGASGKVFKKK